MKLLPLALGLSLAIPALAQDGGYWRATSKTASSITGDLALSEDKLTVNFSNFTIAEIRSLQPDEILSAFNFEATDRVAGNLYRLNIPARKMFLHKNTLCGAEDTTYMATAVSGKTMQVAFFSGGKMPTLTGEALATSTTLCGTYTYSR
jgi:hypothetical protein